MANVTYKKGSVIYKAGERMKEVGLIVQGSVYQKSQGGQCVLEAGHILGLAGCDNATFICDYIAREDTLICSFPYKAPMDFMQLFKQSEYGSVFILAALKQASQFLEDYKEIRDITKEFYKIIVGAYRDYKYLCSKYSVAEVEMKRMEHFTAIDMTNAIPEWKEKYYEKFVRFGLDDLKDLFTCQELCVGTIQQTGGFMADIIRRVDEIIAYIEKSKNILLSEKRNDLFQLMFDLEARVSFISAEKEDITQWMEKLIAFITKCGLFSADYVKTRVEEYRNYEFAVYSEEGAKEAAALWQQENEEEDEEEQLTCLEQIFNFAEFSQEEKEEFDAKLKAFGDMDRTATDGDVRSTRKWLTNAFYKCYKACAQKALVQGIPGEIVSMFLHFGFMDVGFAGEENAEALLDLVDQLFACKTDNVFTFFDWIKTIYEGKNDPSISELDMDYRKFVKESVRNGDIPKDKEKQYLEDPWKRTEYELDNLFHSGGKLTCGHLTTFCPIFCEDDMIGTAESMLVTAMKIREAVDMVRSVDFSLFYREVMFADKEKGIAGEYLNKEVLPQFILIPNAGNRGMMWQPTAGTRNNTPARFMLPILCSGDLKDIIVENCGRYRWEMCRKVQGARWNDITTPSLTSEYSDYLQYYRKNFELSPEAKEKVHNAIKRSRNSNREVFVKDYENWIKFESKGSFRLNKVARGIIFTYCPFSAQIRTELKDNPMFMEHFQRFNVQTQRKLKKLNTLYARYQEKGGEITPDLQENMDFYQL